MHQYLFLNQNTNIALIVENQNETLLPVQSEKY